MVLPVNIGFENIRIEIPDVVLETKSGDFILDSISGGIMSLIYIAWQILLFPQENKSFTLIIDETENHLHPAMLA
jgi:predicted ATPase